MTGSFALLISIVNYQREGCYCQDLEEDEEFRFYLGVKVPVTTLCPCSKEISDYGAHNQRAIVSVNISYDEDNIIWLEDLIELYRNWSKN